MTMSEQPSDSILDRFDLTIAKFRQSATKAKWITYGLRIPVFILGAASTVILGYQMPGSDYQIVSRNIALVLSATITVLVGLASFWDIEAYWLRNRLRLAQLEALREEYVILKLMGNHGHAELDSIINRYLSIVNTAPTWADTLAKKKPEQPQDST
jgi:hypothetical protein